MHTTSQLCTFTDYTNRMERVKAPGALVTMGGEQFFAAAQEGVSISPSSSCVTSLFLSRALSHHMLTRRAQSCWAGLKKAFSFFRRKPPTFVYEWEQDLWDCETRQWRVTTTLSPEDLCLPPARFRHVPVSYALAQAGVTVL